MKHRQRIEDDVLWVDVDHRRELMAIREQVTMAQHDALRRAFGSRREQDDRWFVGARSIAAAAARDGRERARDEFRERYRSHRGCLRDRRSSSTQRAPSTSDSSFAFSMKRRAVTMSRTCAAVQAAFADGRAGREVQHRGHTGFGLQGEECHDAPRAMSVT